MSSIPFTKKYGSTEVLINILAREGHYTDKDDFIKGKLAIEDLQEMVSIQKFRMSPIVTLKVDAFEPQFAQDISNAILEESSVLLRGLKTRQISAKRRFIEERLSEVSNEKKMMQEENEARREPVTAKTCAPLSGGFHCSWMKMQTASFCASGP